MNPDHRSIARAIEWDCSQVLLRFYDCFDNFDYAGMAALFTQDGVWHRAGKALAGREAIVAELEKRSRTQSMRHVVTNLLVTVRTAQEASASCYITAYRHDGGKPPSTVPVIASPYLMLVATARFTDTPQGWLMAEQVMRREFEFKDAG
jgi:ketosteroid isomerase-like protein